MFVALQTHFAKFFERSATSRLCTSSVIPYLSSKSGQAGTMSTVGEGRCAPACVCAIVCPYIPVSACLCLHAHMLSRVPLLTRGVAKNLDTLGIEPRASRMLSGCDTTTPRALEEILSCSSNRDNKS